jgi:hypothetical protein
VSARRLCGRGLGGDTLTIAFCYSTTTTQLASAYYPATEQELGVDAVAHARAIAAATAS